MANEVRDVMADIIITMTDVAETGQPKSVVDSDCTRLFARIKSLKLVRDRFACSTLLSTMLIEINGSKMSMAYEYNSVLYCTGNKVQSRESTEYLHTLGLTMDEWDAMPQFWVWNGIGTVYSKVS